MMRNDLCWCGSGKKYKKCHEDFDERIAEMKFDIFRGQVRPPKKIINNEKDIAGVRAAGVINDGALDLMTEMVRPGIDTATLDQAAADYIRERGGIPACLNYEGYPKNVCISINEVVCHGIPSKKTILKEGDIVNIDVTSIKDGFHGDTSRMFVVGKPTIAGKRLCDLAFKTMWAGIEAVRPGGTFNDIGVACQAFADKNGISVVRDYGGHGIGSSISKNTRLTKNRPNNKTKRSTPNKRNNNKNHIKKESVV